MNACSLVATGVLWLGLVTVAVQADPMPTAAGPQLEFSIALEKDRFEVGEPIVVNVRLVNLGEQAYLVQTSTEETGLLDGYTLVVADRAGQPANAPGARLPPLKLLGSWDSIPRFARYERRFFLNYWVRPLVPGRYTASALYVPHTLREGKTVEWPVLTAAARAFVVEPATGEKQAARVRRMTEESKGGDVLAMDFLGFTGVTEAGGELLDRLYSDEPQVQRRAANALSYLLDQDRVQREAIDRARSHGAPPVFAEWLCAQGLSPDLLVPIFLSYASAKEFPTRIGALTGLRLLHDSVAVSKRYRPQLQQAGLAGLQAEQADVRLAAVLSLGFDGNAEVVAALQALLDRETYGSVKRAAEETLRTWDVKMGMDAGTGIGPGQERDRVPAVPARSVEAAVP